jgi:hypothetical protein
MTDVSSNGTPNSSQDMQLLEAVLETYGSDARRWPLAKQQALTAVLARNPAAQRALEEAVALDRLLDQAPVVSADRNAALADRIAASAVRQSRALGVVIGGSGARVMPIRRRDHGYAAAALAASLVLGIIAGQTGTIGTTAQTLVASLSSDSGAQIAQSDEADGLLDEDLL